MTTQQHNPALRFGIHFVPLFMVAVMAWIGLQLVVSGGANIAPGLVVAAVLAALGTGFALYGDSARDLRHRDAIEGFAARQAQRTMARADNPFTIRPHGPRAGNAVGD